MIRYTVRKLMLATVLGGVLVSQSQAAAPKRQPVAPQIPTATGQAPLVDEQGRPVDPRLLKTANGKPIIFLGEPGKPEMQGAIEESIPQADGTVKHKVRMLKTGEIVELVDPKGTLNPNYKPTAVATTEPPLTTTPTAPAPIAAAPVVPATPAVPTTLAPAPAPSLAPVAPKPIAANPTTKPTATPYGGAMNGLVIPKFEPTSQGRQVSAVPAVNTLATPPVAPIPSTINPQRPGVTASMPNAIPQAATNADPLMNLNRKLLAPAAEASRSAYPVTTPVAPKKPTFWQRLTGSKKSEPTPQPTYPGPISKTGTPNLLTECPTCVDGTPEKQPTSFGVARVQLDRPADAPTSETIVQASGNTPATAPTGTPRASFESLQPGTVILPASDSTVTGHVESISSEQLVAQLRESIRPSQREQAILGLVQIHRTLPTDVKTAFLTAAKDDPAAIVRATAIRCLAEKDVRDAEFVQLLKERATDTDPVIRIEAAAALKIIGQR
ncbi:HEAT repeat domain-containing protein [Tuwongella immobilis]|uniref:---NA---:: HEAT_2 n=1 Tax=Tuwongella immobilis TaxID=692036 RepID=A0A6C2YR61_9BACT|nr:HEAT repeat domain-containing protein [Tuwongella immobilis]VIP03593.1 ---NA--- : : HEAT_2 [Tuwongella immobilis]VTS04554.1 ---NA--- : : HEAT_2 [Tuwongella immobilis]